MRCISFEPCREYQILVIEYYLVGISTHFDVEGSLVAVLAGTTTPPMKNVLDGTVIAVAVVHVVVFAFHSSVVGTVAYWCGVIEAVDCFPWHNVYFTLVFCV